MHHKRIIIIVIIATIMAVMSFITLPANCIVQFGLDGQATCTMPKLVAVIVPYVITMGGVLCLQEGKKNRGFWITLVGFICSVATYLFNR